MADDTQKDAQQDAEKKVNIPENVSVGQNTGYDPSKYTERSKKHSDLLTRFGSPTYSNFEEKLGSPFARAVVAYLLGDAEHAQVLGSVIISDAPHPVPGGLKAGDNEADEPEQTYKAGKQDVSVKNGFYFVDGFKFAEKQKADLYAQSMSNPKVDAGEPVAKPADGAEKTALGADAEIGSADPTEQAQKEKDASGVAEEAQKQADAAL